MTFARTLTQYLAERSSYSPRHRPPHVRTPGLPAALWTFTVPSLGAITVGPCYTKSQARALLKRQLKRQGVRGGIPIGATGKAVV